MAGVAALATAAGLAAVADWVAVASGRSRLEHVAKPATLGGLTGVAALLGHPDPVVAAAVVAALVASLAGDVLLMLPRERFEAGLAAFLAAHAAYVTAFARLWSAPVAAAVAAVAVAAAVAVVAPPVLRGLRRRRQGRLTAPVLVYAGALAALAVSAAGTGHATVAAGALVFLVSDGLLAWDRFVAPVAGGQLVVHLTYHLAQAGLVTVLAVA